MHDGSGWHTASWCCFLSTTQVVEMWCTHEFFNGNEGDGLSNGIQPLVAIGAIGPGVSWRGRPSCWFLPKIKGRQFIHYFIQIFLTHSQGSVFDYCIDTTKGSMIPWTLLEYSPVRYKHAMPFVPTVETTRIMFISDMLIHKQHNVMYIGHSGKVCLVLPKFSSPEPISVRMLATCKNKMRWPFITYSQCARLNDTCILVPLSHDLFWLVLCIL